MSNFIYTDVISILFDSRLVNPGTLIYIGAYGPNSPPLCDY